MLLAIDTATKLMSLALFDGKTILGEQTFVAGNQHNSLLSPAISHTLQVCGVAPRDLTALAVVVGPGSYTGLRIGVAFAKGMASARDLPLIGMSSLDVLALGQPFTPKHTLLAVLQAGRGRVIVGVYAPKRGVWQAQGSPDITTLESALDKAKEAETPLIVTGELDDDAHALLATRRANGDALTVASSASRVRRAALLAEEAHARLMRGKPADFPAERILPIYVNSPA
jgi:tRNA threonylcarbamoyladenosine biosynthesis protein TsaB